MSSGIVLALLKDIASSSVFQLFMGLVIAAALLYVEMTRRHTDAAPSNEARRRNQAATKLQRYAPEAAGFVGCLFLAFVLRLYGSTEGVGKIKDEWPILITADSLLIFQGMLRLLVLSSTVLRMSSGTTLLSEEVAGIALGAALSRVALIARTTAYMLEGPLALGGRIQTMCEVLSMAALVRLCRDMRYEAMVVSALSLFVTAIVSSRNQLLLAGNMINDGLFMFANTAELLAAFAYFSRAMLSELGCSKGSVSVRFAHFTMPLQQCLAAYYFFNAFDLNGSYAHKMVKIGQPWGILQIGAIAQVGAYLGAAVLHAAESLENPDDECIGNEVHSEVLATSVPAYIPPAFPQSSNSSSSSSTMRHRALATPAIL
jgi:hypothetical protein